MAQELKHQTSTPLVSTTPPDRMTFEEFLEWTDEDTFAEWVNGEVIVMSPVSFAHQNLVHFLAALLRFFTEAREIGQVITAPFLMKLNVRPSGREPDIVFIANERLNQLQTVFLDGPADLVVEVVSPDSQTRDRRDKFDEYQRGGVREYWLIDPGRKQADFYLLSTDGTYNSISVDSDGIFRSEVLDGFWLKVDWLWDGPLPTLMSVLKEWGMVD
jgi:Uma2 family endonuclease